VLIEGKKVQEDLFLKRNEEEGFVSIIA
jgi:hypothetical protein